MKIEKRATSEYTTDVPLGYFISSDFKSKSGLFKRLDLLYDIRAKYKQRYRYYSDIYAFNNREGDCLRMNVKSLKSYGIIISSYMNDIPERDSIINALTRFKHYILQDDITTFQLCIEELFFNEEELETILEKMFAGHNITIILLSRR